MIEVFKTNVTHPDQANRLIGRIHHAYRQYVANFDLEDCDRILRVRSINGRIEPSSLIDLLNSLGVKAEVLPD